MGHASYHWQMMKLMLAEQVGGMANRITWLDGY
jgi:hypothetical protein